ncbi:MAG: glycosyltransferase family 39 protein [Planctomycetes bacterium]|nr:glycosyltransferase family 39 protein [Planctomycetota bacterium]
MNERPRPVLLDAVFLVLLCVVVLIVPLGRKTLWNIDEARFADGAKEMRASGDFVIPRNLNDPVVFYPPLMYWLIVATTSVFGLTEFAVRLPSALAAIGCILLTYQLGVRFNSRHGGIVSAVILALTLGFSVMAHSCQPDMVMTFFMVLALAFFVRHDLAEKKAPADWIGFYVAMGMAVLAKGFQGIVIPSMIVFVYLAFSRRLKDLLLLKPWWGALILLAFPTPWVLLAYNHDGRAFLIAHFHENFDMFFGGKMVMHKKPPHYYFVRFFDRTLPWSLFFIPALFCLRSPRDETERAGRRFALVWFFATICFYSLSKAKRYYYMLPFFPAAALLHGWYWTRGPEWAKEWQNRLVKWAGFGALLVLPIGGIVALVGFAGPLGEHQPELIARRASVIAALAVWLLFTVAAIVAFRRGAGRVAFGLVAAPIAAVIFLYSWLGLGDVERDGVDAVTFVHKIESKLPAGRQVLVFDEQPFIGFYLDRPCQLVKKADLPLKPVAGGPTYLIVEEEKYREETRISGAFEIVESAGLDKKNLVLCRMR